MSRGPCSKLRRRRGGSLVLGAAILVLAGCPAENDQQPEPDGPPPPGETARARCSAFYEEGLAVEASSRDEFLAQLGSPEEIEREVVPNRHVPEAMDTLWTLGYEGLEAHIHVAMGRDLLSWVSVSDNRFLRFGSPGVGTSEAGLVEVFGEPYERRPDRLTYLCAPEPMPDVPLHFDMADGRVAEIRFEYYVD